ncbi:MAG TPA: gamma-glutamyltransferase family protein [Rhizobiaceae bacterium]|nr:gamma-glutamyltransferase family protein [Rhizobiaceae bacterium]
MRAFDRPGRSPVYAENGMAATSHPLATATAIDILKSGGNAVDAAIAAAATLAVVEPHMTGIGGDCFAIVAEPNGKVHGLNGSGRAPAAADAERVRALGHAMVPETGPLPVTVPGAVKAWETLLEKLGTLPLDRLFTDAIRYGEDGFAIHPRVARDWPKCVDDLTQDEGGRLHCLTDGKAPAVGARWRFPALAQTLRSIAGHGSKAFYAGEIAAEMAAIVQAKGGFLAESDLAAVTADWVEPISVPYGGYDVLEIPPNGQGITALILFNLLEKLKARNLPADSSQRRHMMLEAARLAYSVRDAMVADPAAMTVRVDDMLSPAFTDALARQFDPEHRNPNIVLPKRPNADTIYLTVVDRNRLTVSFINSLYDSFGCRIVTPKSGIALQNRGACFTLEPGHPNEFGPGKRPMHTIIPAMALKGGRAAVSFGVMGGAFQPMGHAHVFSNLVDYGMDAQEAIDHPRLFEVEDHVVEVEAGIPDEMRADLRSRGHTLRDAASPLGGGQMIVIDEKSGFLIGGSDPRKDGAALGW